ncbi:MAG: CHAD domain-containing protein [Alcanivoracaceae bacterium]
MVEATHYLSAHLVTRARHLHGEAAAMCHKHGTLAPEDVHRLRVITKELRALWQLLRPLQIAQCEGADHNLATTAALLASARDGAVIADTLDYLSRQSPRKSERQVFRDAYQRLFADLELADVVVEPGLLEGLADDEKRWPSIQLDLDDRELIDRGLRRSWRKIRNRLLEAMDSDALPRWHALRKWIKYLGFELALLEQAGLRSPLSLSDTRQLGRDLGHLHDIHILIGHVDEHRHAFPGDDDAAFCLHLLRNHEARMLDKCRSHATHLTRIKPGFLRKALLQQLP